MSLLTGLDRLVVCDFQKLTGKTIGVVCNQATVNSGLTHFLDLLLPLHRQGKLKVAAVFGPQHGPWGVQQDNMIEWEGGVDARTGLPFYSLYGERREPKPEWLAGLDLLALDLPDIGSRYYTFIWTLALCMKACESLGLPILVLDRPNPLGGIEVEGTVGRQEFASFVGLHPLPMRHGMTLGEIARYLQSEFYPRSVVEVLSLEGWDRAMQFEDFGSNWVMPSPNMPSIETARVYPGMCLLEGTKLSEGRGTTRPFEIFGAPGFDGWKLAEELDGLGLLGCLFRPMSFQPTFQKFAGQACQGAFLHVTDRMAFRPVLTAVAALQACLRQWPKGSSFWRKPPYEYEFEKLPFDILAGNAWLREAIEAQTPLIEITERMRAECAAFEPQRQRALAIGESRS
ncbi:MAG: DUF1343 domain-containing protein [Armatimonadetes bacterium]|nr:DUF1343 domain-containing protein [Armatimonadota bacterium]